MQCFVGREHELATLGAALDGALAGQGGAVVLVGEPGIGKTRTVQAFSETAVGRGIAVLWGRCHQEPGAPPYWPWVQIVRRFSECLDDKGLRAALGRGASYVAEICPELRDRLSGLAAPHRLADTGQARFRLFDAVTEFWKRAAATQPLLLIFEDLHWADIPSLRLLEFVAGEAAGSRLLFIGTIRATEVSGERALLSVLGELRRKSVVQQLLLAGLAPEETGRLLEMVIGSKPSDTTAAFVQAKTGGNPLFVAEMARYLAQEGPLGLDARCAAWRVPEGIRAFMATRTNRLSAATQRMLQCAAVVGTRFTFCLLRRLIEDLPEERLLAALQEARSAHIIEDLHERGCYEFGHVLTRDTLYEEVPALERARLHQRIGDALEQEYQHDPAPQLSVLTHHFNAALPGGSAAKAVAYAAQAGEQARARLAYEEAARCFSLALSALDQMAPSDAELRCKLVIALGSAQMKCGHALQAIEALLEAASRASHAGAVNDLAQAAIDFEEVAWRLGLPGARAVRLLEESLTRLEAHDHIARVKLQSALVRALVFGGMPDQGRKLHKEATRLARRVGAPEALAAALRSGFWLPWEPADLEELLATAHETIALARQIGDQERVLDAAAFRLHLLIAVGDLDGFSRDLESFAQLAEELRQPFHQYHAAVMRAARALFVGRFAEAEQVARNAATQGRRLSGLDASGAFGMQMFTLEQERGELPQLACLVEQFVQTTPRSAQWRPALVLVLAELGRHEQARAELKQLAARQFHAVARDSLWVACLAYLAQACAIVRDQAHADDLYALLLPWKGRNLVAASMVACYGPADRFLGMLATVLGQWDAAARHFEAAIEMNRLQGSSPGLAHSQHEYALMLLERKQQGDQQHAHTLLASALQVAQNLGMTKLREAVSELAATLESRPQRPAYPGGLSRREAEVLRMIAAGKSNREIAVCIFRSPNTVANHVRSILTKLDAANRTEAATFAVRLGLV